MLAFTAFPRHVHRICQAFKHPPAPRVSVIWILVTSSRGSEGKGFEGGVH